MKKTSSNTSEQLWRDIMRLADRLSNTGKIDCDLPNRLPLSQLRVVGVIYDRHPEGVMLKDIADELKLTPGAISQTVDVLVRENIVERATSQTDRRAILLRPTAAGLELKEKHSAHIQDVMDQISSGIPQEDFAVFARVAKQLLEQINQLDIQKK